MIRGLEDLTYEERLSELCLFSPERRRFRGEPVTMYQYMRGGYQEAGKSFFTKSHVEKSNGYKLLPESLQLALSQWSQESALLEQCQ